MTPAQFRTAIDKLDLSQVKAAAFLGYTDKTVRRWLADEHPIPECAAKLLRLMVRLGLKPEDVR